MSFACRLARTNGAGPHPGAALPCLLVPALQLRPPRRAVAARCRGRDAGLLSARAGQRSLCQSPAGSRAHAHLSAHLLSALAAQPATCGKRRPNAAANSPRCLLTRWRPRSATATSRRTSPRPRISTTAAGRGISSSPSKTACVASLRRRQRQNLRRRSSPGFSWKPKPQRPCRWRSPCRSHRGQFPRHAHPLPQALPRSVS
jgi:hypothetical protein